MQAAPLNLPVSEAPDNGKAYWTYADDGLRLRLGSWIPDRACKGSIFMFPGRTENIENYGRKISQFYRRGYAALVIDWRGQGLSDRMTENPKTGHVIKFSDHQRDVAAMVTAAQDLGLPKPWYLVAHSMGACIGLRALIEGLPVTACALTAPMWEIKMSALQRLAAKPISWSAQSLGYGHSYVPGYNDLSYVQRVAFADNQMTSDPDMYQYWHGQTESIPDRQIGGPSMNWLLESLKECRNLAALPSPDIPCIAFCGDQDDTIDIRAIEHRMARWPGGKFELIPNGKHELLSEIAEIREPVLAKTCAHFAKAGNGINYSVSNKG